MHSTPETSPRIPVADPTDECYRCGYALHGIANDQACPECGLLAERSRRVTDELHNTRPKWLARLSLGTKLMLAGLLINLIWPGVFAILDEQVRLAFNTTGFLPWWYRPSWFEFAQFFGLDVGVILFVPGIWLLTSREGFAHADDTDRARRVALRVTSAAPLLTVSILHITMTRVGLTFFSLRRASTETSALWAVFWTLVTVASLSIPPLLFRQLRSLAVRARSAHLAEHCTIVGIGAACSLAFLLLALLTLAYPAQFGLPKNWTTTSEAALWIICAGCVGACLFLLWSMYLFLRFTISFHRAARAMRTKWVRDDRSLTSAPPDVA